MLRRTLRVQDTQSFELKCQLCYSSHYLGQVTCQMGITGPISELSGGCKEAKAHEAPTDLSDTMVSTRGFFQRVEGGAIDHILGYRVNKESAAEHGFGIKGRS